MNKKQKPDHKIIQGLREAIAHVAEPAPVSEYDRISGRMLKAISELNAALSEAHQCAEMRVFIGATAKSTEHPMQFSPQIYRLTHSTMTFTIKQAEEPKSQWQAVKDPSFREASGQGLDALRKKAA